MSQGRLRYIIVLLAILGVGLMGYLAYVHVSGSSGSVCNIGEGLSCDLVNTSIYSKIFGMPMSFLGLFYFLAVLGLSLFKWITKSARWIFFGTIIFLGPSLYLTGIEFLVLESICIFCEGSKLLMIGIVFASGISIKGKIDLRNIAGLVLIAVLLAGATYLIQRPRGPQADYSEFAQCLTDRGFRMYGSITCQFCARQRALFGEEAFEHAIELECDPRNPGYVEGVCEPKRISHTPTWIQEDEFGNEVHRFESGVQPLETLAEASGCELPQPSG